MRKEPQDGIYPLHLRVGKPDPWFWGPGVGEIESTLWRTGDDIIPPVVESLQDAEHNKRVEEPTRGAQIWVKPMATAGRRAVAVLNRTGSPTQIKLDWKKLGLNGIPKSLRDVWQGRDLDPENVTVSVPAHDLALFLVTGEDKPPIEYPADRKQFHRRGNEAWADLCATAVRNPLATWSWFEQRALPVFPPLSLSLQPQDPRPAPSV